MVPYILDLPTMGLRVADLVDVDSEKWRALSEAAYGPMRLVYRREWRRIGALERRITDAFDRSLLVSTAEAAVLSRLAPARADRIQGISNGVDHRYFHLAASWEPPFDSSPPAFVFTGTMDYAPNIDAVTWFASEVLPLIQKTAPNARFVVVGANPTPAVLRLGQRRGVTVTGHVPDVRPYLAHATAAVAPLRIARGIQNKVLEAMAMARPVVLTAAALEGIAAVPGQEVLLAETPDAFAKACCAVMDDARAAALGAAARARVLRDHDWDATLRPLADLLRTGAASRLAEAA
jgi:sugar transferase (PEP-CTERM/EpsH1 system associated)